MIGTSKHASPEALLDAFHATAAQSDLGGYFGCFAPTSTFLGTAKEERWTATEFLEYARPIFASGQGWTYTPIPGTRYLQYYGSDALSPDSGDDNNSDNINDKERPPPVFCTFDELLDAGGRGGPIRLSTMRGSGSLVRVGESWLVASYHLSFPVPNECVDAACAPIIAFEQAAAEEASQRAAEALLADLECEEGGARGPPTTTATATKKKGSRKKPKGRRKK